MDKYAIITNILGIVALFSIWYAGKAIAKFVESNRDLTYRRLMIEGISTFVKYFMAASLAVKTMIIIGFSCTVYALGTFDLFGIGLFLTVYFIARL